MNWIFLRFMQACKAKSCHPVVELPPVAHPPGHIIIYVWLEPFSLPAQKVSQTLIMARDPAPIPLSLWILAFFVLQVPNL